MINIASYVGQYTAMTLIRARKDVFVMKKIIAKSLLALVLSLSVLLGSASLVFASSSTSAYVPVEPSGPVPLPPIDEVY
jgi:energy-converting hydrogenase Eha subunit H